MTSPVDQMLLAVCGGGVGLGVYLLWWSLRASRTSLRADLDALYAAPAVRAGEGGGHDVGRWIANSLRRAGMHRALLCEDLAIAGTAVEAHTSARLIAAGVGVTAALGLWAGSAAVMNPGILAAPLAVLFGATAGVWIADRRIRSLATTRRREAQLAVAAYLDLVRILLAGGLPLLAALRAAADAGNGWAFAQLRQALSWAHDRGLPADEGLRDLGQRIPVPEFADLAATITSARRGASPLQALEGKAAFMRGAQSAQARAEAAVADAQIELPAAAVALAFMFFLTYPLMTLISNGTGVLP